MRAPAGYRSGWRGRVGQHSSLSKLNPGGSFDRPLSPPTQWLAKAGVTTFSGQRPFAPVVIPGALKPEICALLLANRRPVSIIAVTVGTYGFSGIVPHKLYPDDPSYMRNRNSCKFTPVPCQTTVLRSSHSSNEGGLCSLGPVQWYSSGIGKSPIPPLCGGRFAGRRAVLAGRLAETEGFEPSVPDLPVRRFSKPLVSATHPRLRIAAAKRGL